MPVGIYVPYLLVDLGMAKDYTAVVKAVGDNVLIVFYCLLRVGKYMVKIKRNNTKQTVQFKLEDAMFFRRDANSSLHQLPINAPDEDILSADRATLKLDNQTNGWKDVCVYQ